MYRNVKLEKLKNLCYHLEAQANKNLCYQLEAPQANKNLCYQLEAQTNKNLCYQLEAPQANKNLCYQLEAPQANNKMKTKLKLNGKYNFLFLEVHCNPTSQYIDIENKPLYNADNSMSK
ncbi:STE20 serine/threonine-protein kinase [Biomphalaria glabrata]|nr:Biomphalaria glabrata STE20-like serine/threonine-protein kinase [Biomphalaria glabrata]KAI8793273.1 STE20 serine/threonine-protein kinase [Biomphalaria glabrata]